MQHVWRFRLEHRNLLDSFKDILGFISKREINFSVFKDKVKKFYSLWNKHEIDEENMTKLSNFSIRKMLLDEHKQFKGHWRVLNDALKSNNEEKLRVALDTDGKILFDKFRNHIRAEETAFEEIYN